MTPYMQLPLRRDAGVLRSISTLIRPIGVDNGPHFLLGWPYDDE